MSINWNLILIIAGIVLILVEAAMGGFAGFDLVLIGSAILIGGGLGLVFNSPPLGLIVASVLSLAYIAIGRRWVRRRMRRPQVPTNVDALIGAKGVVTVRVAPHAPGQVKLRDETWRAIPASGTTGSFEPGAEVTVAAVDGVTLQVR